MVDSKGKAVYSLQQSTDSSKGRRKEEDVAGGQQKGEPGFCPDSKPEQVGKKGSIGSTQEIVLLAELNRTGVTLDEVLKRYKIDDISQMTPEIYGKAIAALKQTKPKTGTAA